MAEDRLTMTTHALQMIYFLKTGANKDVEFVVGKEKTKIKAHKTMLMIRSTFFAKLFDTDDNPVVSIEEDDCTEPELQLFLEHVYAGHGVKSVKDAFPLLKLSAKYVVLDLMTQCADMLKKGITDDTAFAVFEQSRKYGDPSLHDKALEYICRRAFIILDSCPDFVELSEENVKRIITRDNLCVIDEMQVFNAVMRWGKAVMERQKLPETEQYLSSLLVGLIPLIRFPLMSRSRFYVKVLYGDMRILTSEQSQEMRDYFSLDDSDREEVQLRIFSKVKRVPCPPMDGKEIVISGLAHGAEALTYSNVGSAHVEMDQRSDGNASHYNNVNNFILMCSVCHKRFKDENGAKRHTTNLRHAEFTPITPEDL